jgi:hypothetical protein
MYTGPSVSGGFPDGLSADPNILTIFLIAFAALAVMSYVNEHLLLNHTILFIAQ